MTSSQLSIPSKTPSYTSSPKRNISYTARTNTPSPLRHATLYSSTSLTPSATSASEPPARQEPALKIKSKTSSQWPTRASLSILLWPKARNTRTTSHSMRSQSLSIRSSVHSESTASSSGDASPSPAFRLLPVRSWTSDPRTVTQSEQSGAAPTSNHTWHVSEGAKTQKSSIIRPRPEAHTSFFSAQRREPTLQIHPLLAHTRFQRAPFAYDITQPPSLRSLIDSRSRSTISAETLAQPASNPAAATLTLDSPNLPWLIVATSARTQSKHGSNSHPESRSDDIPVTVLDVLHAVHVTLATRVTPQEWTTLGHGSRAQRRIMQAYERRCVRTEGDWEEGIRRIDYLCGKMLLVGVEVYKKANKQGVVGRLVFSSP
ncbi:hypothetical protein D9615_006851 [Tricholomella constricta]|uniref:DUF6699 domain-containing protein n=1 Tax=Tricholomella constricta TaxID=117010 RepID=A0A8H5H8W1_9AGAR|nr:hypothetical protein D9615_006851 [Tricholomella constricta]